MNPLSLIRLLASLAVVMGATSIRAATFFEVADAGAIPSLAQGAWVAGQLDSIAGRIEHAFDADLYELVIDDPPAFSATAVWVDDNAPDLQLFLFDAWGYGVVANDNRFGTKWPLIPTGSLSAEATGVYLLAVSAADSDPLGVFGEIFPDDTTGVVRPTGASRIDLLLGWTLDFTAIGGNYTIALTGAAGMVPFLAADFDEDGDVDGDDLARWSAGYSLAGTATHGDGDADGDCDVDGRDFLMWQRQYGSGIDPLASSASVPEPAESALAALGIIGMTSCFLRKHRHTVSSADRHLRGGDK